MVLAVGWSGDDRRTSGRGYGRPFPSEGGFGAQRDAPHAHQVREGSDCVEVVNGPNGHVMHASSIDSIGHGDGTRVEGSAAETYAHIRLHVVLDSTEVEHFLYRGESRSFTYGGGQRVRSVHEATKIDDPEDENE